MLEIYVVDNETFRPFAVLKSLSLSYNQLSASNIEHIINGLNGSHVVVSTHMCIQVKVQ